MGFQGPEPIFTQPIQDTPQAPNIDLLRANPVIQRLLEERVSLLKARMKSEFSRGNANNRRKSGRYNTTETPCAPVFRRWPNESCPTGGTRKRTVYDDLTLGEFVIGFLTNIIDTQNSKMSRHMMTELLETVKLSENLSWPIARGAFAVAVHKVEDETATWADTRFLAENRLTYSQTAVFNGLVTLSPKTTQPHPLPNTKHVVCRWFNEGTCPHLQDHNDSSETTTFRQICSHCFRVLKCNNGHPGTDCLNKKKSSE